MENLARVNTTVTCNDKCLLKACALRQEKPSSCHKNGAARNAHIGRPRVNSLACAERKKIARPADLHALAYMNALTGGDGAALHQVADGAAGRRAGRRIFSAIKLHPGAVAGRGAAAGGREHIKPACAKLSQPRRGFLLIHPEPRQSLPERSATMAKAVPVETTCGGRAGSRSSSASPASRATLRGSSSAPNSGSRCVISPKRPFAANLKAHRHRAHVERQRHRVVPQRLRREQLEHAGRAQRRMAGKVQLLLRGEDAHPHALGLLDGGGPALDEGGLREVEFARDRLHLLSRKTAQCSSPRPADCR